MIALLTSPSWRRGPELVDDLGHTSLRALALATPFVLLLQIALGASYRHNLTGVLPHMGGALVATILSLIVCLIVTQDFGEHRSLHSAAVALLSIILTQITLGIVTFTMKLLNFEDTVAFLFSSMLHVMVGSLTLAATVVMAMQVLRNVHKSEKNLDATATDAPLRE
jgi:heme A synthase